MTDQAPPKKRVTPGNLLLAAAIVALVQLGSLAITGLNGPVYSTIVANTGPSYAPAGSSATGSALNAILLVASAFVLTLGLVWLLRRKKVTSFKVIVFSSVAFSGFILTLVTADDFAVQFLPATFENPVSFGGAALIVLLLGYIIFVRDSPWLSTLVLAFVGAEVGSFFAETLPPWTALALPIAFSIYDIYAVFRGPLKALIGTAPSVALVGMSIKAGEFTLGLGDVVFYTLLPSLAYFQWGIAQAIYTIVAIDVGMVMTLFLLSKRRLLPGLPIPMLLGISAIAFRML
ncbi:MAG TPA: presenilin family intramembrane aspartyl protease [Nitrososphaerales archaeon]|nr:presenilin family intramembrane aspartyl protease [Nitrososphaerales archaeon]